MSSSISFDPYATTSAAGSFSVQSEGLVQGMVYTDPATRFAQTTGIYSAASTLPLWGGLPISESVSDRAILGGSLVRATAVTNITGFSVDQGQFQGVTTPASTVPSIGGGSTAGFYRLGSGARIGVACDPSIVAAVDAGELINTNFSWDFNAGILTTYDASTASVAITSMTYDAANGGQIDVVTSAATLVGAVGDSVTIAGATTTGTGGNAAVNGTFVVTAFTDNEHFSVAATNAGGAAYYGVITTTAATVVQGTGILPIRGVLEVEVGNSMTAVYNPVTNTVNWNRNGSAAIILL